jgi:K319-like protein
MMVVGASHANAFKILAPAENGTLKSGQTITAKVDQGHDIGIVKVRYYWYSEGADTLVEQEEQEKTVSREGRIADDRFFQRDFAGSDVVAIASLVSTGDANPPFGGALKIPKEALGPMRLLAVADISRGRFGTRSVFDEVLVTVEPEAQLTSIDFETDRPLYLGRRGQEATYGQVDTLGKIFDLPVLAQFSDGVARSLTSPVTGRVYKSSNDKVIKVLPEGMLQLTGNGRVTVSVTYRDKEDTLEVIAELGDDPNEPPVADVGPARTVKGGARVKLNGLKSRDPEGEALFYSWSQVRGSKVPLLDVNMPEASFLAPQVSESRTYRFKLRVTDKKGADSLPAFVNVTVLP